jgi:hypothetical protein
MVYASGIGSVAFGNDFEPHHLEEITLTHG